MTSAARSSRYQGLSVQVVSGEGEVIPLHSRPYSYPSGSHCTVSADVARVAEDFDLSKLEYRVWLFLMPGLSAGRFEPVNPQTLAETLRVDRSSVSGALNNLVEYGILCKRKGSARPPYLMINPVLAFKGSSAEHRSVVSAYGTPLKAPAKAPALPAKGTGDDEFAVALMEYLLADMADGRFRPLSMSDLARKIGSTRSRVSTAVALLVSIGALERDPANTRPARYRCLPEPVAAPGGDRQDGRRTR